MMSYAIFRINKNATYEISEKPVLEMRIIFILIGVCMAVAADFENKYWLSSEGKLIDHEPVDYGNYRFIASFRRKNVHFCTASLLSNKHALTTATCLTDFLSEERIPDFDSYTLEAGLIGLPGKSAVFSIEEVQCHRRFTFINPMTIYDIGIITLRDNNVTKSEYVGWGLLAIPFGSIDVEQAEITRWASIHETERGNEKDNYTLIQNTVRSLSKCECGFLRTSPILCVQSLTDNRSFFREDIGTPLSEGNFIRGILVMLPSGRHQPLTFLDIQKYLRVLGKFRTKSIKHFRTTLPRKKARYNPVLSKSSENRRVKPKLNDYGKNGEVSD